MEIACMPDGVPGEKKSKSLIWLAQAGFENIVLDTRRYCFSWELEHQEEIKEIAEERQDAAFVSRRPELLVEKADKLIAQCGELGQRHTMGTVPSLPWDTEREDLDDLIHQVTRQGILAGKRAGCRYLIVNPLVKSMETEEGWRKNIRFYCSFAEEAAEAGICILVPNAYRNYQGHPMRGTFSDPYELKRFTGELKEK